MMTTRRGETSAPASHRAGGPLGPPVPPFPGSDAWIDPPEWSPNTSARFGARDWRLTFEPRARPSVDPLTGWSGGGDPLLQVALRFPSRAAAVAYAQRHALPVTVAGPSGRAGRHREPDTAVELALIDPARVFRSPRDVVDHPSLTRLQKREILKRWEWDARLIETATAEAMPDVGEPSRLDEVLGALADLDAGGSDRPPRAPAAARIPALDLAEPADALALAA